MYEKLAKKW